MPFGATPLDGSSVPIPMSSVVPDGATVPVAIEGGPSLTSVGNPIAPVSVYVKDGNDLTQGTTTDAANANTVIGQLKQIKANTASVAIGSLPAISGIVSVSNFPSTQAVSGAVGVSSLPSLPAGTALIGHVIVDSAGSVSVTSLPSLPAGTAVIGHVIIDSASNVAVTALPALPAGSNAIGTVGVTSLPALPTGSNAIGTIGVTSLPILPAGTNLIGHVIVDSAGAVSVTSLPSLPAGTNVIGHVVVDSGTVSVNSLPSGGNQIGSIQIIGNDSSSKMKVNGDGTLPVVQSDQSTSGTLTAALQNTQFDLKDAVGTVEFFLAGTFSSGSTVVFEQSADNTNWLSIFGRVTGSATVEPVSSLTGPGPIAVLCNGVSAAHVRARCTVFQAGDSINVTIRSSVGTTAVSIDHSLPPGSALIGGTNLVDSAGTNKATVSAGGALKVDGSAVTQPVSGAGTFTVAQATGSNLHTVIDAGSAVIGSATIQATSGTALGADQGNTELKVSNYGKNSTAGDTAVAVDASGRTLVNIQQINGQTPTLDNTAILAVSLRGKGAGTAGDTAIKLNSSGDQYILGDFTEIAGAGTGTVTGINTDFIASTDVSAYKWFSVQLTGTFNLTLSVQVSNDNVTFVNQNTYSVSAGGTFSQTFNAVGIFHGPVIARYLRVRCTVFTSNTSLAGNLELYTEATSTGVSSITQAGAWSVGLSATDATQIASAAFTTTQTGADQTNTAARGVRVVLDVTTVGTGSVTLAIQAKDVASGKYVALLTGAAVVTNSTNVYVVYPGLTPSANAIVSDVLPHTWRVVVTANNANSVTYSVGASYLL